MRLPRVTDLRDGGGLRTGRRFGSPAGLGPCDGPLIIPTARPIRLRGKCAACSVCGRTAEGCCIVTVPGDRCTGNDGGSLQLLSRVQLLQSAWKRGAWFRGQQRACPRLDASNTPTQWLTDQVWHYLPVPTPAVSGPASADGRQDAGSVGRWSELRRGAPSSALTGPGFRLDLPPSNDGAVGIGEEDRNGVLREVL